MGVAFFKQRSNDGSLPRQYDSNKIDLRVWCKRDLKHKIDNKSDTLTQVSSGEVATPTRNYTTEFV